MSDRKEVYFECPHCKAWLKFSMLIDVVEQEMFAKARGKYKKGVFPEIVPWHQVVDKED